MALTSQYWFNTTTIDGNAILALPLFLYSVFFLMFFFPTILLHSDVYHLDKYRHRKTISVLLFLLLLEPFWFLYMYKVSGSNSEMLLRWLRGKMMRFPIALIDFTQLNHANSISFLLCHVACAFAHFIWKCGRKMQATLFSSDSSN